MTDLSPDLRDLLTALHEALTVPIAATDGDPAEAELRLERMAIARGTLSGVLEGSVGLETAASACRLMVAEKPATYRVYESEDDTDHDGSDARRGGDE